MVAALYPPDINYQMSRAWLRQHLRAGGVLFAPMLLLSEVSGAVTRRSGDEALGQLALDRLIAFRQLRLVPLDARLGLHSAQIALDLRLRGADAVYVALADQLQIPLITWDREQRERGGQRIDARQPGAKS
jgi:predicted nucleic acid-binding protein